MSLQEIRDRLQAMDQGLVEGRVDDQFGYWVEDIATGRMQFFSSWSELLGKVEQLEAARKPAKRGVFVTVTLEADMDLLEDCDHETYDPSVDFESMLTSNSTPFVNYEIHEIDRSGKPSLTDWHVCFWSYGAVDHFEMFETRAEAERTYRRLPDDVDCAGVARLTSTRTDWC